MSRTKTREVTSRLESQAVPEAVCAIIVTFHPDIRLVESLESLDAQVGGLLVVDNGSGDIVSRLIESSSNANGIELIRNSSNRGVTAALNQGFAWALQHGYRYALSLDQDSCPEHGMVEALLDVYARHPSGERIAISAPQILDLVAGKETRYLRRMRGLLFERTVCSGQWIDDVSIVISSGALFRISTWQDIGGFREEFFIDYGDTDYCLQARHYGHDIVVACNARLSHQLGNRQRKSFFGIAFYPTFHAPERWYYIARNRIPMIRMHGRRFPYWLAYEIMASAYGLLKMLLFEDRRLAKLAAILYGTLDAVKGRMGVMPESVQRTLSKPTMVGDSEHRN